MLTKKQAIGFIITIFLFMMGGILSTLNHLYVLSYIFDGIMLIIIGFEFYLAKHQQRKDK